MFVIAGLGNPGLCYRKTRHNIGFMALDVIAERIGVKIKDKKFSGLLGEGELNGERVILVKPQTYMNLSGDCLQQVMHFYKLPPEKLIVLCECGGKYRSVNDLTAWKSKYSGVTGRRLINEMVRCEYAYNVTFRFCDRRSTARLIIELLTENGAKHEE